MQHGTESTEPQRRGRYALLELAFRPFFMFGALFSIVSLVLWAGLLAGSYAIAVYANPLWWHSHEMLFGFVGAIVVGFLLTAVRTWTGQPGLAGAPLGALVFLWLLGRLAMLAPAALPGWASATVDLAFLPVVAVVLARPIIRVRQWRNIAFAPIVLAMALANAAMHWAAHTTDAQLQSTAATAMVLLVTLLMTFIGGRVLPMFTASGTGTERVPPVALLEKAALASLVAAIVAGTLVPPLPPWFAAAWFYLAAVTHGARAWRWKIWVTRGAPLVWSLHLAYWCIPLGLLLYGLSLTSPVVTHSQAIHTLTVGAMGSMILAMISRVSLGHTGRPLKVGRVMAVAFAGIFLAFLVRVFGVYAIDEYLLPILLSVALWVVAYGSFVIIYLPVLARPRVDGRPG